MAVCVNKQYATRETLTCISKAPATSLAKNSLVSSDSTLRFHASITIGIPLSSLVRHCSKSCSHPALMWEMRRTQLPSARKVNLLLSLGLFVFWNTSSKVPLFSVYMSHTRCTRIFVLSFVAVDLPNVHGVLVKRLLGTVLGL